MYEAQQQKNPEKIQAVIAEMENTADFNALYTAGQLWNEVPERYLMLFYQSDIPDKQIEFAGSVNRIAARLSGDVKEKFFAAAVVASERYQWQQAQEIIVQEIAVSYGNIETLSPRLQRLIGLQKIRKGAKVPEIAGLTPPVDQPLLVIFYESGCGHCQEQLAVLKENYPVVRDKGVRVVTVSADESQEVYEYHSKDFPWPDKLCDYKGFEGVNFINYGVIGTPGIYRIDKEGILLGRYGIIADTGLLN
jgi:thiol-disulfide isomerase/thioredoxin